MTKQRGPVTLDNSLGIFEGTCYTCALGNVLPPGQFRNNNDDLGGAGVACNAHPMLAGFQDSPPWSGQAVPAERVDTMIADGTWGCQEYQHADAEREAPWPQ